MNVAQRLVGKKFKDVYGLKSTQVYQGSNELQKEVPTNSALQNQLPPQY